MASFIARRRAGRGVLVWAIGLAATSVAGGGAAIAAASKPVLSPALSADRKTLTVTIGTCSASFVAEDWSASGSVYTARGAVTLKAGKLSFPIPTPPSVPFKVDANGFKFSTKGSLPLPEDPFVSGLATALGSLAGETSFGVDWGVEVRKKVPSLFLKDDRSYLYFTTDQGFDLDLARTDASQKSTKKSETRDGKARSVSITPSFAIDPCDPAIFMGGLSVTVGAVTASVDGLGFSLGNNIQFSTSHDLWKGDVDGKGAPIRKPYALAPTAYLTGAVDVGLGRFASVGVDGTVALRVAPGGATPAWKQLVKIPKGEFPQGEFALAIEGEKRLSLSAGPASISIPMEGGAGAFEITRSGAKLDAMLLLEAERGPSLSVTDMLDSFGVSIPGFDNIGAGAKVSVSVFAKGGGIDPAASLTSSSLKLASASFGVMLSGDLWVADKKVDSNVRFTYDAPSGDFGKGKVRACLQLPTMAAACSDVCAKTSDCGAGLICNWGVCSKAMPDGAPCYSKDQCSSNKCLLVCGGDPDKIAEKVKEVDDFFQDLGDGLKSGIGSVGTVITHTGHSWGTCRDEAESLGRQLVDKVVDNSRGKFDSLLSKMATATKDLPPSLRLHATRSALKRFLEKLDDKRGDAISDGKDRLKTWRATWTDLLDGGDRLPGAKAKVADGGNDRFDGVLAGYRTRWMKRFPSARFGGELRLSFKATAKGICENDKTGAASPCAAATADALVLEPYESGHFIRSKRTGKYLGGDDTISFGWDRRLFFFEALPAGGYALHTFGGPGHHVGFSGSSLKVLDGEGLDAASRVDVTDVRGAGAEGFVVTVAANETGDLDWAPGKGFGVEPRKFGSGKEEAPTYVFEALDDGSGAVMIRSKRDGRYLFVRPDGAIETAKSKELRGRRARFQLEKDPTGAFRIWSVASGEVLAVTASWKLEARAPSPLWEPTAERRELFVLTRPGTKPTWQPYPAAATLDGKTVYIRSVDGCASGADRCGRHLSWFGEDENVKLTTLYDYANLVPWRLERVAPAVAGRPASFRVRSRWGCEKGDKRCDLPLSSASASDGARVRLRPSTQVDVTWELTEVAGKPGVFQLRHVRGASTQGYGLYLALQSDDDAKLSGTSQLLWRLDFVP